MHFNTVYVKNRQPHASINKSPYEAITGNKPDLRHLRVFGSRVVAQTPRSKTGKLDHNNITQGIFVGFTGTEKNVYFIDDKTKKMKIGSWIDFDEAHYSVPANFAPIAAQALQRVGYHAVEDDGATPFITQVIIHQQSRNAKVPSQSKDKQFYHLPLDIDSLIVPPRATKLIQTGIAMTADKLKYADVRQIINTTSSSTITNCARIC